MVGDRPEVVLVDVPGVAVEVLEGRLVAGGAAADQRVPVQIPPVQVVGLPGCLHLVALRSGGVRHPAPGLLAPVRAQLRGPPRPRSSTRSRRPGGLDRRQHHLARSVHAVPDHGAVVVGEVRALAPAEPLGPVQGPLQPPVGLRGQHDPALGGRERHLLEGGVGAGERDRRPPARRVEHLDGGLPVVGHQRQLAVDAVADDQATVRCGLQPRQRRRGHAEPGSEHAGRLHQVVVLDTHHPDLRGDLGQQFGRHVVPGLAHAVVVVGGAAGPGPRAQAGGPAAAVAVHRDHVERAPQPAVGGRGQAGVQRVVAATGEPADRAGHAVGSRSGAARRRSCPVRSTRTRRRPCRHHWR